MSSVIHNKLVRDNIPKIIVGSGKKTITRNLGEKEYIIELKKKLQEELDEFLSSGDSLEELADIIEVVEALAKATGSSLDGVMKIKAKKQAKNGAFDMKIFLERVEE